MDPASAPLADSTGVRVPPPQPSQALVPAPPTRPRGSADHLRAHQFKPGQSGNPGGTPKGFKHYRFARVVIEAMDKPTEQETLKALRACFRSPKRVLEALTTAGRFTKEIGLGSEDAPVGVTIVFTSPLRKEKLR